ncbi:hypothetical protein ACFQ5M_02415 [Agrilactobacillus yilanensis]|uniref:MFS transporter n=1 Tax=Agrilactobacillus yilanensis TaxID=2485997 RepID=A0ABW4J3I7_9LACO|nr:hypothetical protein [Agrilactobacillus yilanensis]
MSTVMMINPLIVGFATSIGASALVAGLLAAMMNLTSLIVRPFAGRISDQVSKYRLASIGSMQLELIATF